MVPKGHALRHNPAEVRITDLPRALGVEDIPRVLVSHHQTEIGPLSVR